MSVNVPQTEWRPTSGIGESGSSSDLDITTLSGVDIASLAGVQLVTLEGTYTPLPASEWAKAETTPASEWRPTDGLSEFSNEGPNNIVDTLGVFLVDPSAVFIVDTGVIEMIPDTEWIENDGE